MKLSKILCASLICTTSLVYAQKKAHIEYDVIGYEESAFGTTQGYLATKSSTGSKMDVDITKIPQSVSVLTKDLIEARGTKTIQQALSYTAAVGQNYGVNGDTRYNFAKLRGNSSLYYSTFLDGLKVLYNVFAVPRQPIYSLERVEILKGPSSALYGASAPGGLLNLQSKRANYDDEKEIVLNYGSFDTYSFGADITHTIKDNLALRVTAEKKDGKKELKRVEDDTYFINTALKHKISDNTTLDIIAQLSNEKLYRTGALSQTKNELIYPDQMIKNSAYLSAAVGGFVTPTEIESAANTTKAANIPNDHYIGHDSDIFERKNIALGALLNHHVNDKLQLNSNIRVNKVSGKYLFSGFDSDPARFGAFIASKNYTVAPLEQQNQEFQLKGLVWDNYLNYDWNLKNIQNKTVFGLDLKYQEAIDKEFEPINYSFDLKNPNYSQNIGSSSKLIKNTKEKLTQIGIYAQNQATIFDKTIITTNLRYDKVKKDAKDSVNTTNTDLQKDDNISGRIGLAYEFDNGITPYASVSSSFLTNPGRNKQGKSYEPSVGKQVEVGAKYYNEDIDSLFTISAYQIKEDKILTPDPSDSNFSVQVSNSDVKGIEFDATFKPIDNLNIIASLSRVFAKEKGTTNPANEGRELANVPKMGAVLWSDYTFENTKVGNLKIGAGIKYTGKSVTYVENVFAMGNPDEKKENEAYTTVDTLISTKYKNIDLAFNINNLFDKKARIAPTAVNTNYIQGRTFNLALKYKF